MERLVTLLFASLIFANTQAASYAIDSAKPSNGLIDIYSATFDPPLIQGSDPFFNGIPPTSRAITFVPNPTGVFTTADTSLCVQAFDPFIPSPPIVPPCTTLYPTATPSSLDLTLSAGNTQLAINDGNVFFPNLLLVINGRDLSETVASVEGASMINFAPSVGTVPVDGNGVAVFEIDIAPMTAVDFAAFTETVTGCSGQLCALFPILTLDMQRYRLIIDWDPTFSFFMADFIGQTANNSMIFASLDSVAPVPIPAAIWLFGSALGLLGWLRRDYIVAPG